MPDASHQSCRLKVPVTAFDPLLWQLAAETYVYGR